VLARPEALLSTGVESTLSRLAGVLGTRFEREFLRSAGRLDARQRRALVTVTVGAAARLLASGSTLAEFFEQVEYNGRRLAKLDLPPGIVHGALRQYLRMLDPLLKEADLRAACEQMTLAVLLTLSNAFYEVRETETEAFFDLSRAELEARTESELLEGVLAALVRFCRAAEARLYVFEPDGTVRLAAPAASGESGEAAAAPRVLERPRYLVRGSPLVIDSRWRARFASFWSVPMRTGRVRAAMQFAFAKEYEWLPRELRLLTRAAGRAALAWEKQRLAAELADREQRLARLAHHMAEVEESERRRISRELHDETGQVLLYLRLKLDMLSAAAPEPMRQGLTEAGELIDRMVVEIRRLIADLSPSVLDTAGLGAAVRQLVTRFRRASGLTVRMKMSRLPRLPGRIEVLVYRLLQECTSNIARHSTASAVNIFLNAADGRLRLAIHDDGAGFRVEEASGKPGAFGLAGMRERVALAGGSFGIQSQPGKGTRVEVELPAPQGETQLRKWTAAGRGIEYGKNQSIAG
jgi:signal transduction histidine kinase